MAELLASAPDGNTLVLEHLPGTTRLDVGTLDAELSDGLVASFFTALGRLHRLDPAELDLPGFTRPADGAAAALDDLVRWRAVASAHDLLAEPMIAYAFAWLERNPPTTATGTVLVQGDTGPGNFLHHGGRVTGLIDWEFAHLGDPMDDVAWVDMRAGIDGAFGDSARRDLLYREVTGVDVDPDAVRYYAALVQLRCAVTTGATIGRGGGALGLNAYMAPHHRFITQLGAALADAAGFTAVVVDPVEQGAGVDADQADDALEQLRTEMHRLDDASGKLAVRERLLLAEHDAAERRWGEELARPRARGRAGHARSRDRGCRPHRPGRLGREGRRRTAPRPPGASRPAPATALGHSRRWRPHPDQTSLPTSLSGPDRRSEVSVRR